MIDAYLFAAAYALKEELEIEPLWGGHRQDLTELNIVDSEVLTALAAGIYVVSQHKHKSEPTDAKETVEILTQYAEVGLKTLQQRWKGKIREQIQNDISKLMQS